MSQTQQFLLNRPHILARGAFYSFLFLMIFALSLSWFTTINIVAKGTGVISTVNGQKDIYVDSNGVLLEIFIKKGEEVKKGQILATISTNEIAEINTNLENSKVLYNLLQSEYRSIEKSSEIEIFSAEQTLIRAKEQKKLSENLFSEGFITKIKYLKAKDELASASANLVIVKNKYLIKLNEIKSKILTIEADNKMSRNNITLSNAKRGNIGMHQDKNDAIYSPVDGIVALAQSWGENMSIKNNLPVFVIVPKNEDMIANVEIPTSKMTNVILGQDVRLKIDAYPYKQFGVWKGKLTYVSATSKLNSLGEFVYETTVKLDKNDIKIKNKPLIIGQTLHAEIVVARKRIIIYLLDYLRGMAK
ncbi:HlyD family efflux transporter periplasmic adaptor subunit [Sulfurimonas aquatica]|uniref:HlyD family efflux transporter periplasmic adaptor subunit n=1 Tax=Sulfurimonas aquatica TaxID=2672570 RepID=A0A975B0B1_9BACT|nr:HlyD family efflux transporter periplasmic adaptor subunit [Sulfurimonas aquatica]QSZ41882.1 HlyD family efflux transporter periplasmic adaptor subunit [Sulfurimonas aquatica]